MRADLLADLERASGTYFSAEQASRVRDLLAQIHAESSRLGARTLFVFAPEKMQVLPRPHERLRAAELVAGVAEQTGAAFVDLTPHLVAEPDLGRFYLPTVGTWRAPAYALTAAVLDQAIAQLGWIDELE